MQTCLNNVLSSFDICSHRFIGMRFTKMHLLQRRCMDDNLRARHYLGHTRAIPYVANEKADTGIGKAMPQRKMLMFVSTEYAYFPKWCS